MKLKVLKQIISGKLLGNPRFNADFLKQYDIDYDYVDNYIVTRYGQREVIARTKEEWFMQVEAVLYAHKYRLEKLFATLGIEYNPLENVTDSLTETIKNDNVINKDNDYGERKAVSTEEAGVYHASGKNDIGESKENTKRGSHIDTVNNNTTNNVAPFNSSAQHPKEWRDTNNVMQYGDQIDSTDRSPRHDTNETTIDAHTDTNTITENPRKDTENTLEDLKQVRTLERHANVGVLSNQDLIKQERDVANFIFWEEVAKTIVSNLCCLVVTDLDPCMEDGYWG